MDPSQITTNLAFVNWTVLVGLATGTYAAVALGRLRAGVTRGYAVFTTACVVAFAGLAYLSDTALPPSVVGSPVSTDPTLEGPRRLALAAFAAIALLDTVALVRGWRWQAIPAAGLAAAAVVLGLGAASWGGGGLGGALLLLLQLAILAGVTGGVFAAMILGHWYLVTPKLSERPLILFSRLLLGLVAAQAGLFVIFAATGAGPAGSAPFDLLLGEWALFGWLRLTVGLIFPLVLSWAALQTARTRSMESATGLLYIDLGAIAAGTILAAGLYFGAGRLA